MSSVEQRLESLPPIRRDLLRPLVVTTATYWLALAAAFAGTVVGIACYVVQYRQGLGVTSLHNPVYWGIYIIDFVFFIGISHAGTLISAILRVSQAEWRRAITRSAEFITVLVLGFGAIQPIIDLGRPDRMLNILFFAHMRSPLLWDVVSITVYFTASTVYLYLPMLPDLAIIRDSGIKWPGLYRVLALGFPNPDDDSERARRLRHRLERVIGRMAIAVIPVAISVHTIIGFIFALTLRPGWHSTIFGPYFVVGAIYSGIAALFISMFLIRKNFHLEHYLRDIHFEYLGRLFLVMTCLWLYFTGAEYLTAFYGHEVAEMRSFWDKFTGAFAVPFWAMVATCFVIPFVLMVRRRTRTPGGCAIAGVAVVIGMWLERYNIVVVTGVNPRLEAIGHASYAPSLFEWGIALGTLSGFITVYLVAAKLFPMVSIWEVEEGLATSEAEVADRIGTYLPKEVQP